MNYIAAFNSTSFC